MSEFWAACRTAWRHSTDLANFCVSRLLANDSIRKPGEVVWKESSAYKMPKIYLYSFLKNTSKQPYAGRADWDGAKTSACSLIRAVAAKYEKRRVETVWMGTAAASTYKYPFPYPVHNQSWKAEYRAFKDGDGKTRQVPVVSVVMSGRKWTLRLRDGYFVRKHLTGFSQIVKGLAIRGELAIYGVRASKGCHLRVGGSRSAGGGNQQPTRILCKIAAYLPNDFGPVEKTGTLCVRTGGDALLVAQFPEDNFPWVLKNNQIRQKVYAHKQFIASVSADMKAERRPNYKRKRTEEMIDARCKKHDNRIDSFIKETAAHLVAYAVRRKAATLEYRDYDRRYLPNLFDGRAGFPWAQLKNRIEAKCEEARIVFTHIAEAPEVVVVVSPEQEEALRQRELIECDEMLETIQQRRAELISRPSASGEVVDSVPVGKRRKKQS